MMLKFAFLGSKKFYKYWWSEELSILKRNAIDTNKVWKAPVSRAMVRYSISSSPADVSTASGFARSKTRKLTRILMLYTMLS